MTSFLFIAAFAFTGAVLVLRSLRRRRRCRAWSRLPGRSLATAQSVTRFDEMDAFVTHARCTCGGRLVTVAEGSSSTPHGSVRVIHTACRDCEAEHDFFFDTSRVAH